MKRAEFLSLLIQVPDALGACIGAKGLIISETDLAPEFFDLRTGLAGEVFQKFMNYKARVAILLPDPDRYGDRFSELATSRIGVPEFGRVVSFSSGNGELLCGSRLHSRASTSEQ